MKSIRWRLELSEAEKTISVPSDVVVREIARQAGVLALLFLLLVPLGSSLVFGHEYQIVLVRNAFVLLYTAVIMCSVLWLVLDNLKRYF